MQEPKVICIGFHKTGTSSLGLALSELGYTVAGYMQFRDIADDPLTNGGDIHSAIRQRAAELIHSFDAFKDTPWPLLYKEMDEWLPNSKFILITRDEERWLQSVVKDFGEHPNPIRNYIYGAPAPVGNEETYLHRYKRHNTEVLDYFSNRPNDLLHLHLDHGEVNWTNICQFLDKSAPDRPWPHANTAEAKKRLMIWLRLKTKILKPLKLFNYP